MSDINSTSAILGDFRIMREVLLSKL